MKNKNTLQKNSEKVTESVQPASSILGAAPAIDAKQTAQVNTTVSAASAMASAASIDTASSSSNTGSNTVGTARSTSAAMPKPTFRAMDNAGDANDYVGVIRNGSFTNDNTPTMSGKSSAGAIITIYDNGVEIARVTAKSSGTWSYTPTLSEGRHKLSITTTNKAGVVSDHSDSLLLNIQLDETKIDIEPPSFEILDHESEEIVTGITTDSTRPQIMGYDQVPGHIVKVYNNKVLMGTATVEEDGSWLFIPNPALEDGKYSLTFSVAYGSVESEQTEPVIFTVDSDMNVIEPPSFEILDHDSEEIVSGITTDSTRPQIMGYDQVPGHIIKVYNNKVLIGTATVEEDSSWLFIPNPALEDGEYSLTFSVAYDDVESEQTEPVVFTVDSTMNEVVTEPTVEPEIPVVVEPEVPVVVEPEVPVVVEPEIPVVVTPEQGMPVFQGIDFMLDGVSLYSDAGCFTKQTQSVLSGATGAPGATLMVSLSRKGHAGKEVLSTKVNADGSWSLTLPELADGTWKAVISQQYSATNQSYTYPVSFVVDRTAPELNTEMLLDGVSYETGIANALPATTQATPTLSGTGEPGAIIVISVQQKDSQFDAQRVITQVRADGTWSKTLPELTDGEWITEIYTQDVLGNCNMQTYVQSFVVATGTSEVATEPSMSDDQSIQMANTSRSIALEDMLIAADEPLFAQEANVDSASSSMIESEVIASFLEQATATESAEFAMSIGNAVAPDFEPAPGNSNLLPSLEETSIA